MTHAARRLPALGRGAAVAAALAIVACATAPPARAVGAGIAASRPLVVLLGDHVARTTPSTHARRIASVDARRPLTGVRTTLPLLGRARGADGRTWLRVLLPGRPNGHAGWIAGDRTRSTTSPWHITVDLSERWVLVSYDGRGVRRFPAVVGTPSTPTPVGRFFVEEALTLSPADAGGPYALATSARSDVLQEFEGGPGQIALHGTANLAGVPGSAASHGCIRLSTRAITWLAGHVGSGTPLTVRR